jgi:predicted peptidase
MKRKPLPFPGIAALCLALATQVAFAQPAGTPSATTAPLQVAKKDQVMVPVNYLLHLPGGYRADEVTRWPLLLFLHGSGESGDDLEKVKKNGPPKLIEAGQDLPFIVVSPQAIAFGWDAASLGALLDSVERQYRVDPDRVYVTGLSMGGYGTWAMAAAFPHRFAAIAPVCGFGMPETAASLRHLPIWAFHGALDTVVPPEGSANMVKALRAAGSKEVQFTLYDDAGHDVWTRTYDDPKFWQWLAHQKRGQHGEHL